MFQAVRNQGTVTKLLAESEANNKSNKTKAKRTRARTAPQSRDLNKGVKTERVRTRKAGPQKGDITRGINVCIFLMSRRLISMS